ncbi:MAG: OmpA family protein [Paludibacteraceae bacterium]
MKKLLLGVLVIASAATFTNAQTTEASKWSIALKGGATYYRVTPTSTPTEYWGFDGQLGQYLSDASWGAGVSIEKTCNPLVGLGLNVDWMHYNRNVLTGYTIDPTLFASINLTNLFFPHRNSAKFNVYSNFGAGVGIYNSELNSGEKNDGVSPLFTSALAAELNLGRRVALGLEAGYRNYYREDLGSKQYDKDKNNDALTAMISLRFKLGSQSSHVRDLTMDQYYPAPEPVVNNVSNPYDDSALSKRLNNADKRLGDIENRLAALEQGLKDLANRPSGTVSASFDNIEFEFDSDKLTDASYPTLNEIATILKNNPTWGKLSIQGNTDNVGPDAYNQKLSEKRAKAVVNYLVSKGVSASALTAVGYGESRPIASNATSEGRQKNRRVEFEISK